ncbi:MAG TPA: TolC family protein [Treponema sp.]|nr:TolC family protein [Treponema sp.]
MKAIKRLYMLPVLLICAAGLIAAQDKETTEVLTVDRAVELAMQNNIQLASTAIDVRIKKRSKDYAWNVFIPGVQATGTLARSNNASNPYAGILKMINPMYTEPDAQEKDHWNVMAGLNLSLNLNLALVQGFRATRQNYEAGLLSYEQARQETEGNVKKAFYGILLQEGSLDVSRDKLEISIDRLNQTRINYKNGLVPELAYLQTQLAVETQKPVIMEAELNLEQQKNMFAFLLGLPIETKISLDGEIEPNPQYFNADELVNKHLGNRLDLAILQKNQALLETQLKATQLQRFTPSIALSQSFAPRLSAIDDSWLKTKNWDDSSGAFSLTIAFNLTNMLPFSSIGVNAAETRDNLEKISMGFNQMVYQAELEIRNLVKKLDKANAAIKAMDLNVEMAQKAYNLTEQGYRAGTIEYLDLKDSENTLVQARLGVLSEKFNYLSALLDLEKALNTKLR